MSEDFDAAVTRANQNFEALSQALDRIAELERLLTSERRVAQLEIEKQEKQAERVSFLNGQLATSLLDRKRMKECLEALEASIGEDDCRADDDCDHCLRMLDIQAALFPEATRQGANENGTSNSDGSGVRSPDASPAVASGSHDVKPAVQVVSGPVVGVATGDLGPCLQHQDGARDDCKSCQDMKGKPEPTVQDDYLARIPLKELNALRDVWREAKAVSEAALGQEQWVRLENALKTLEDVRAATAQGGDK